jgi:hypothetical protein
MTLDVLWVVLLVLEGLAVCFIRTLRLMEIELGADMFRHLYKRWDEPIYYHGLLEKWEAR